MVKFETSSMATEPDKKWPPCDPATICPTKTKNGRTYPDGYHHNFSRFVPLDESKTRDWPWYFDGGSCPRGHVCPRPVSNPYACRDCRRIKEGLPAIGATARHQEFNKPRSLVRIAAPVVIDQKALEPSPADKRFLAELAEHRDFDSAAKAAGTTTALVRSRLSYSAVFKQAVADLTAQMQIRQIQPVPPVFEWSDEKKTQLIRAWINGGNLDVARESIGVLPADYFDELERDPDFAERIKATTPLAARALEDRAVALALAGNSNLLQKLLASQMPDKYRDRLSVEMNNDDLSQEQLNAKLDKLIRRLSGGKVRVHNGRIIAGDYTEVSDGGGHLRAVQVAIARTESALGPGSDVTRRHRQTPADAAGSSGNTEATGEASTENGVDRDNGF